MDVVRRVDGFEYWYKATVNRLIDGDTIVLDIALGFGVSSRMKFRVAGIDTPEVYGVKKESEEYKLGKAASEYGKTLLPEGQEVLVRTHKDRSGKYGRYLADIYVHGSHYGNDMIKAGHAKPYDGGKR